MSATEHRIDFRGQNDEVHLYSITVSGSITAEGDSAYPYDRVSDDGRHATGIVTNGTDAYTYTGEVEHIHVEDNVEVSVDGSVVHPDSLVTDPDPIAEMSLPDILAEKYDFVDYDAEGGHLSIADTVQFHWPTVRDTVFGGAL